MAYTQQDLDNIEKAIANGVLSVRHSDGKQVTYRSMDELKEVRALIKKSLNQTKRRKTFVGHTSKGYR